MSKKITFKFPAFTYAATLSKRNAIGVVSTFVSALLTNHKDFVQARSEHPRSQFAEPTPLQLLFDRGELYELAEEFVATLTHAQIEAALNAFNWKGFKDEGDRDDFLVNLVNGDVYDLYIEDHDLPTLDAVYASIKTALWAYLKKASDKVAVKVDRDAKRDEENAIAMLVRLGYEIKKAPRDYSNFPKKAVKQSKPKTR